MALASRVTTLVAELHTCQQAIGSGFISAWPATVLDVLERGDFSTVWAPWYTLHKILAGLVDVHLHLRGHTHASTGDTTALAMAHKLAAYLLRRVDRLRTARGEEWWQATLEVEFGGIGEAAYRLAELSADNVTAAQTAMRLGRAFIKQRFTGPLARGQDSLGGRHANTHLPLLVNAARGAAVEANFAEATGLGVLPDEGAGLRAVAHGYCTLQLGYAYAGAAGSSVNEHWPDHAAATGAASRVLTAPKGVEDVVGGCIDLADAGECERSAAYMLAHCAAACAARQATFEAAHDGAEHGGGEAGVAAADAVSATEGVPAVGGVTEPIDSDAYHTQESCTQYNALKLNLEIFRRSPDGALADAFERKLLNGVLGIAHPDQPGRMLYMLPLGSGVTKARANVGGWGDPEDSFWCCYGTGIESFAKIADGAFFQRALPTPSAPRATTTTPPAANPPVLVISQFIPSTIHWGSGRASAVLSRELSAAHCTALEVRLELQPMEANRTAGDGDGCFSAAGCILWLRMPSWADPYASSLVLQPAAGGGEPTVLQPEPGRSLNGVAVGRFVRVERTWANGDALLASFGMYTYLEPLNDWRPQYESTYALLYGPFMMVGVAGDGSAHALRGSPSDVRRLTNVTSCTQSDTAAWARLKAFRLAAPAASGGAVELVPLPAVVDESYSAFFSLA